MITDYYFINNYYVLDSLYISLTHYPKKYIIFSILHQENEDQENSLLRNLQLLSSKAEFRPRFVWFQSSYFPHHLSLFWGGKKKALKYIWLYLSVVIWWVVSVCLNWKLFNMKILGVFSGFCLTKYTIYILKLLLNYLYLIQEYYANLKVLALTMHCCYLRFYHRWVKVTCKLYVLFCNFLWVLN